MIQKKLVVFLMLSCLCSSTFICLSYFDHKKVASMEINTK